MFYTNVEPALFSATDDAMVLHSTDEMHDFGVLQIKYEALAKKNTRIEARHQADTRKWKQFKRWIFTDERLSAHRMPLGMPTPQSTKRASNKRNPRVETVPAATVDRSGYSAEGPSNICTTEQMFARFAPICLSLSLIMR